MSTSTPRSTKAAAVSRPMDPAPMIRALLPAETFARLIPCITTANGSTSATDAGSTPAGISNIWLVSARTNSASPPSRDMPCSDRPAALQVCERPVVHGAQVPHLPVGRIATRRPSLVVPPNSWPRTTPERPASIMCRSLPQIPLDVTLMSSPTPVGTSFSTTEMIP